MSSSCLMGKKFLKIEKEEGDYPFNNPDAIYLNGFVEDYYPQTDFSWEEDSIVIKRQDKVIKYTIHNCSELKAKDKDGNIIWIDGTNAPYEGDNGIHYLDETRELTYFIIEEFDNATKKHITFKVPFSSGVVEALSDYHVKEYFTEKNSNNFDTSSKNSNSLQFADESLKKDKEFILDVVSTNGYALDWADDCFKKDKEVALAAVRQNPKAFEVVDSKVN